MPATILVVDDNPIMRKLVRVALRAEGYVVAEAEDGRSALALLERERPDLVLLDLVLPDIPGADLVKRLRALPAGAEIPILALTGFSAALEHAWSARSDFTDFLFKPIEPSRLVETVGAYLPSAAAAPSAPPSGRRVLVADDDPIQLKLARIHLQQAGFEVATAEDGEQALEHARAAPPDLILSDVLMPRLDGFRLCLAVRQDPRLAHVPVLLVSAAYTEEADRHLAESVGARDLILRPPDFQALVQRVQAVLSVTVRQPARPVELPPEEYTHRIIRQLERQARINIANAIRLAWQEAELAVLARLPESVTSTAVLTAVLDDLFLRGLDALGISTGAAYLVEGDGSIVLHTRLGFPAAMHERLAEFFGHPDVLRQAAQGSDPLDLPSAALSPRAAEEILAGTQTKAMLLTPFLLGVGRRGVLVIGSASLDFGPEARSFARAMGAQISHALMLAETFSRLRAEQERLALLLDTVPDGVLLLDREGRIVLANPEAERILGASRAQMLGRRYDDPARRLTTVDGAPLSADDYAFTRVARAQAAVYGIEHAVTHPDGARLVFSINAAPLHDPDGAFAGAVAALTDVTARIEAEQRLQEQARLSALAADVGVALTQDSPLGPTLQRCCEALVEHLDAAFARVWTLDPAAQVLELRASAGLYTHLDGPHSRVPVGQLEIGLIAAERAPHLTNTVLGDPRVGDQEWARREGMVAFAGYPLLVEGELVGVMAMFARHPFTDFTYGALGAVAHEIALGIRRTDAEHERLRALAREQAARVEAEAAQRRASFLAEASRLLGASLDYEATLKQVAELAVPTLADWCVVHLLDPGGAVQTLALVHRDPARLELAREYERRYLSDPRAPSGMGRVLGGGPAELHPEITDALLADNVPDPEQRALIRALDLRSAMLVPLRLRGETLGGLAFVAGASGRRFDPADLALAEELADRAAVAIDNARLFRDARRSEREARALYAAALGIGGDLELDTRLGQVLDAVLGLLGIESAHVALVDADAGVAEIVAARGAARQALGVRMPLGAGLTGEVLATGQPVYSPDLLDEPRLWDRSLPTAQGVRSWLGVPLADDHGAYGILTVLGQQPHAFTADHRRLLQAFAALAGGAVREARLYARAQAEVAERRRAEEELRRAEVKYRALVERLPGTACIYLESLDPGNPTVYVSPQIDTLLGYTPAEWLANAAHWTERLHPDDRERVRAEIAHLHATGQPMATEYRMIHRDGPVVWVSDHAVLLPDDDRGVAIVQGMVLDITEQKRAEEALRIAERQAQQAEKLRALGQLASGTAHDLNQSLGLVLGHAELGLLALERPHPVLADVREALQTIRGAADTGADTVKRLLRFGRSQPEGPAEPVAVGALLQEVAQLTAPRWRDAAQAEGRPLSLHVDATGELVVQGWAAALREALTNLVFNAVDALPRGGTIRLAARRVGERVEITVADNGIGMSAEVQQRIFEPFYSTKGERGTGLGLAMVYGVVERHGGVIAVESAPGAGASFRLSLPAASASLPERTVVAEPDAPSAGLRLLVVDDELALAEMAGEMLRRAGHQVTLAGSGEEALERLAAEPVDLVVSDVGMGEGMNGWELTAEVKRRWPALRVVLATGWGTAIDPEDARAKGVEAVLAKPYRMQALLEVIASGAAPPGAPEGRAG